jgi:transposase InsO family protein
MFTPFKPPQPLAKATPTGTDNRVGEFEKVDDNRGGVSSDSESEPGERDSHEGTIVSSEGVPRASGPDVERIPTLPSHLGNLFAVLGATEPTSEQGEVKMSDHTSSAAITSRMKIDSENPNTYRRSFVNAINFRKAQGNSTAAKGTAQEHEDKMYSTCLFHLGLTDTKTDLEINLGLEPRPPEEEGQGRWAAAVPGGTLIKNLPPLDACEWGKATCIHRLQLLYLSFLDPMEKKQIIAEVTRGRVVQGTNSFQSYADELSYKVHSTDGEVGDNEHKRLLIQGSNQALPKQLHRLMPMHAHLDDLEASKAGGMTLRELVDAGKEYERTLHNAASRANLKTYLVDDKKDRAAALLGFSSHTEAHEYVAAVASKHFQTASCKEEMAAAAREPEHVSRVASVEADVGRLQSELKAQATKIVAVESSVNAMQISINGNFEKLFAEIKAIHPSSRRNNDRSRSTSRERPSNERQEAAPGGAPKKGKREPKCSRCGVSGHWANICPASAEEAKAYQATKGPPPISAHSDDKDVATKGEPCVVAPVQAKPQSSEGTSERQERMALIAVHHQALTCLAATLSTMGLQNTQATQMVTEPVTPRDTEDITPTQQDDIKQKATTALAPNSVRPRAPAANKCEASDEAVAGPGPELGREFEAEPRDANSLVGESGDGGRGAKVTGEGSTHIDSANRGWRSPWEPSKAPKESALSDPDQAPSEKVNDSGYESSEEDKEQEWSHVREDGDESQEEPAVSSAGMLGGNPFSLARGMEPKVEGACAEPNQAASNPDTAGIVEEAEQDEETGGSQPDSTEGNPSAGTLSLRRADPLFYYEQVQPITMEVVDSKVETIAVWEQAIHLIRSDAPPGDLWRAVWKASLSTAQVWGCSVEGAIESVLDRVRDRTKPSRLSAGDKVNQSEAEREWKRGKEAPIQAAQTTGNRFPNKKGAILALGKNLRDRQAEQCPMRPSNEEEARANACGRVGRGKREDGPPGTTGHNKLVKKGALQQLLSQLKIGKPHAVAVALGEAIYSVAEYTSRKAEEGQQRGLTAWRDGTTTSKAFDNFRSQWEGVQQIKRRECATVMEKAGAWHIVQRWRYRSQAHRVSAVRKTKPKSTRPVSIMNQAKQEEMRTFISRALSSSWQAAKKRKAARIAEQKGLRREAKKRSRITIAERTSLLARQAGLAGSEVHTIDTCLRVLNSTPGEFYRLSRSKSRKLRNQEVHMDRGWQPEGTTSKEIRKDRERSKDQRQQAVQAQQFIASVAGKRKSPELDAALLANRWHSMVVTATIHDGERAVTGEQLADSGAVLTIQRMEALRNTIKISGLEPQAMALSQADGAPLKLAGQVTGTIGFEARDTSGKPLGQAVYKQPMQVSTERGLMPLIGVDFWARQRAVKDYARSTITMDAPLGMDTPDGLIVIDMRTSRTPVEEEQLQMSSDSRVAVLSRATSVKAVARLKEDIVVAPHTAIASAVPMWVDAPLRDLNAGVVFRATPLITCEHTDIWSENQGHPDSAEPREGLTSMPEMLTNPMCRESDTKATVYLAVANPGSEPLILRAGSAYATLEEIREDEDGVQDEEVRQQYELQRIAAVSGSGRKDNLEPTDPLHNQSAKQIIEMVDQGVQFGKQTLDKWVEQNRADLKFGPRLSEARRAETTKLLYALADTLACGSDSAAMRPGTIKGVEHTIELINPEVEPTKTKSRQHPPEHAKAIDEEVNKMLEHDIIETSNSPWAAPVVLVKKKDGRWRFCVDYRMTINPVCRKDAMPLPKIADLLEQMGRAKEMSVMDICSGYWSCVVRECDRQYLAFNTASHGLMTFKRMPFGMATSGATMQRAMNRVLARDPQGPILNEFASVYIDDITVYSEEAGDRHLEDLCRVLKQVKANGIILKLKKCTWCTDEATIMGFTVKCGQGIAADTSKVEDLCGLKGLPTVGALKSFLGSCVYLSRYIKDFATLTAPLYELERAFKSQGTPLHDKWTDEHQLAFQGVKAALASGPVLAFPNFDKPFILLSDCSNVQKGGVLLQIDEQGVERPIAYASQRLNAAEVKYSIQAKEAVAGLFCIRKWRKFLLGSPTVWITDHASLTSLRTKQDLPTTQMDRIAMELMEYDLDIVHRPGKHCHMADLLSRAELEEDPEIRKHMVTSTLGPKAREMIKARLEQIRKSPAERALEGDGDAYSDKEIQKHIRYMVLGANTALENPESGDIERTGLPTVKDRVQEITAAMERGDHVPKFGEDPHPELLEEDPRMIEAYDMVCPATRQRAGQQGDKATLGDRAPGQRCEHCGHTWVCKLQPPQTHRLCKTCSREGVILDTKAPEQGDPEESPRDTQAPITREGLRQSQQEDKDINEMKQQLQDLQHQAAWDTKEREFADKFQVVDGLMCRREWIRDVNGAHIEHFTILAPEEMQERILREVHEGNHGEHQGFITTYQRLKARFYWRGMYNDTREYTKKCDKCQHFGSSPAAAGYADHLRADRPGQKWVADVLYLENDGDYEMAVTLVDVFSRWAIVRPIKDRTSETVASTILQMWAEAGVHFVPETIVHDNGSEFKKFFEKVCEMLQIDQSWSVAGRPESHGVIEKFNQDISQLLGKKVDDRKGTLKPHQKKWSWALPSVVAGVNSAPSRANSIGLRGFSPSEIFHGMLPVCPLDRALQPRKGSIAMSEVGMEEHMEAVRSAQRRAIEFVEEARLKYEDELDHDRRSSHKPLRTFQPGDLVLRRVSNDQSVSRKTKPTYEEKPYVVIKSGHRGNYAIQPQREVEAECKWIHVDQVKAYMSDQTERREATRQLDEAIELEKAEYYVEAITGHRGRKYDGTREVLVKWVGYDDETWEPEEGVKNPELLKQYFRRGNPQQKVYELARTSTVTESFRYEALSPTAGFIQIDILQQDPRTLIKKICQAAGVHPSQVIMVWASPPCETFTNAAYNVGRGEGHGYNYRDFKDPERGPCCEEDECPYRQKATLHDKCVPHLQEMVKADWQEGFTYDYVVENPHGCLGLRPYMETNEWPEQRVNKFTVDQCAFGKLTQKPTDLWTSLSSFRPIGSTGDGRCHSRCGRGYFTETGSYKHVQAYAQEPHRQPRGPDRVSIPPLLLEEVLGSAFDESMMNEKVVIDLYCGYRSVAPVAESLGIRYIGVDIARLAGVDSFV